MSSRVSTLRNSEVIGRDDEKCCGKCCWFKFEDTDGWGYCSLVAGGDASGVMHCSDLCTTVSLQGEDGFVSNEEKRHHLVMLRKCQRCLHLAGNKDMDVVEIQRSIDFVVDYCKRL